MRFIKLIRPDGSGVWLSENGMTVANAAKSGGGAGGAEIRLGDAFVQTVEESPEQVVALFRQLGLS
jgi:hypothetical protein